MASAKRALTDLTRSSKSAAKDGTESADRSSQMSTTASEGAATESLFDIVSGKQYAIPHRTAITLSTELAANLAMDKPLLVTCVSEVVKLENTSLAAALLFNKAGFMNNPKINVSKGGPGRGQQVPGQASIKDDIHEVLLKAAGPLGEGTVTVKTLNALKEFANNTKDISKESVVDAFEPVIFGMQRGTKHCGTERHCMSSLRLSFTGSRRVVAASFQDVYSYMLKVPVPRDPIGKKESGESVLGYSLEQVTTFFAKMTQSSVESFSAAGYPIMAGTVGSLEVLYLPAGWIVMDMIAASEDCFGIKLPLYMNSSGGFFRQMGKLYGFGGKNVSMQVFLGRHAQATEEEKTGWAALASLGSELAVEVPES